MENRKSLPGKKENIGIRNYASQKGVTLIALAITIIVLLILAAISITTLFGGNGIFTKAQEAGESTEKEKGREAIFLALSEMQADELGGLTLEKVKDETHGIKSYLPGIEEVGEIDPVNRTLEVTYNGYVYVIDGNLNIIGEPEKAGGVKPIFEVHVTKVDGSAVTSGETEKALTVNITNIGEFGSNYTIEVKHTDGTIPEEISIVGNGQASYKIIKSGSYVVTVKGTERSATQTETVTLAKATTATQFSKAKGVIDIVWLDTDNNKIGSPISPSSYLGGLTAVKYDGANWVTADTTNSGNDWYNYVAQTGTIDGKTSIWANARTSNGNAYFVWIPRYAYKITYYDESNNVIGYSTIEGMIDTSGGTEKIVQGTEPTNVDTSKPVKTADYTNYIPHPAFEFDGAKAGIWVGKYESSGSTSEVKIIPNTSSLRSTTVSNIFTACQGVKTTYGLSSDSHMMKNIEWGAVAYLTESKYGRNGTKLEGNNSNYITGGGDYISNKLQSTTGNIYGIYDMNGTSTEYVAGYVNNNHSYLASYSSNLLTAVATNSKYADVYKVANGDSAKNNYAENQGVKGDAVAETSISATNSNAWNKEYISYPNDLIPLFRRGRV